ncbi:MAG: hypothetical protein ICV69_02620 [Thermoleophilaceae bacterium]|nr:hypothetical protein [Thermoleophilaceae bacterium]
MIPLPRLLLAAGVCSVLALATASPALGSAECRNTYTGQPIANCTTLAGPWVAVPALQRTDLPPTASWGANCASGAAVGADYRPDANQYQLGVSVDLYPGAGVYQNTSGVGFLAINPIPRAASFQPLIGCLGGASAAAVGEGRSTQRRSTQRRITTRRLRPRRTRTYSHACRSRERLVRGSAGVGFFERRPPTARELRQLDVRHAVRRGRVRVTVRTGKLVGDDERVRLQIHAVCRP